MTESRDGRPGLDEDEAFPLVSKEDIGSASRSCAAIIFVLLFIVALAIVFVVVQTVR